MRTTKRTLVALPVFALSVWLGSTLAGCFRGMPPCECPPARSIEPGTMVIKRSSRPELIGGTVDVQPSRVVIRYTADDKPREIVFSAKPN
jgi:hypothetical protein